MAALRPHIFKKRNSSRPRPSWRSILRGVVRWSIFFLLLFILLDLLVVGGIVGRLNALFALALFCVSFAYLLYVAPRVHVRLPGIDMQGDDPKDDAAGGTNAARRAQSASQQDTVTTIQVTRLSSEASRVTIANESLLPVLRAQTTLTLARETDGESTTDVRQVKGDPFSMHARSTIATGLTNTFNHVGIFRLSSTGIRIYDLLGVFSRVHGASRQWRVRVVPNIYRLAYGIPRDRTVSQTSLGIPNSPADALDYDRVRDYRPGDPLKTIHWKLVAHTQGVLYTKLFETPTISTVALVVDPYGASIDSGATELAFHLHDTMLEGSFSLIEHARQYGIPGFLRYANRAGSLVEARWSGPITRSTFVETAQRPSQSTDALNRSVRSIRSLRHDRVGYAIFATSGLTEQTVSALIACHEEGCSLLVVHALPAEYQAQGPQQRAFDARLRASSITVIGLTDGYQIIREASTL